MKTKQENVKQNHICKICKVDMVKEQDSYFKESYICPNYHIREITTEKGTAIYFIK